jgi:hypothetical protein
VHPHSRGGVTAVGTPRRSVAGTTSRSRRACRGTGSSGGWPAGGRPTSRPASPPRSCAGPSACPR